MSARHLRMAPSFSPAAAKAYSNLAAFGLQVTEVHVRLTGPDGTARDTTINFPADQDTLVIDIPVDAAGTDQTFTALLELRNADHVVLFSGTQTVIARTVSFVTDIPSVVVIQYVRPDARTKTVAVSPADSSVGASATVPVSATAVDSSGVAITELLVSWTTSDATLATVTSTGTAAASVVGQGRRGVATIRAATVTGIIGTSRISFVPPPSRVVVVSGGAQTGVAGSLLAAPFVVEVQAADNLPVAGAPVTFRAITAGGVVTTVSAVSDAAGRASTTLTLGKTGGAYQYEVASGALPAVQVTETATPAPPAAVAIASGNAQVDSVGRALALPLVVKVTDEFGGAASGATVTWMRVTGSGAVGTSTSTSGSDGLASTTYTLGNTVGSETISATVSVVSGAAGTTTFTASAISRGAATIAVVSGGAQTGAPGVTLPTPLVARVADVLNNPVANATVAWNTPSAGTTFTPASSVTNALGQVTTSAKLGSVAGPVVVSATTSAIVATANLTIVAGPAAIIAKVAGDAQTAEVATNVPVAPSAKVTDASGNAIAGAAVVFSVTSGGGTVSAATASTDASGVAAVGSWKLGNTVGANTLNATAGALSTTFTATSKSGTAAKLAFVTAPPASITVGATIPVVTARITDALDNAVALAGTTVTATGVVTPGGGSTTVTATTDATGLASFTISPYVGPLGSAVLTLSAPGLSSIASSPITVNVGAPSKLSITTQPSATAASGAAFPVQPAVQLTDAGGNATSVSGVSITATIGSGGGTLGGTQTVVSTAAGLVTFTDLAISGTSGPRALTFAATGLTSIRSNVITLGAGAAASMTKNGGDAQSATAGSTVAVAPSVVVKDAAGNPVSGAPVTFAVATGGGSVGAATATTNASGVAAVGSWKLGDVAGPNALTATSGAFTSTFTATATAGSAAKLAYVTGPPSSITVGAAVAPITGRITDALNNPVATAGITITATAVVTPGGVTTPFTATTDATGLATFTPPTYNGTTGTIVLTLTSPGLTSVASSPITVNVGAPAKLAIKTQPSASAASGVVFGVQPVLQLTDAGDNPVPVAGTVVTAAIATGGGTLSGTQTVTTSGAGAATFTNLAISGTTGARTLTFTSTGPTATTSNAITLGAGVAAAMTRNAGDAQTATAGSAVAVAPSVVVRDAAGNPVAGATVTFAVASGGGSITAPSATTNASGTAAIGSWTLGTAAGANTLSATSGTFSATFTATGTAGAATKFAFVAAPPASLTVGGAGAATSVQLVDALGNSVAQAGVSVTATEVLAPSSTVGTVTAATDATGLATLSIPSYTGTVGSLTLTYRATGINPLASPSIPTLAGMAAKLLVSSQPTSAVVGSVFAPQPVIQVADIGNNPVSVSGTSVAVSVLTGGGTLGGTTTVVADAAGKATFTDLVLSGTIGDRTFSFTSGALSSATSSPVTFTAGAAAKFVLDSPLPTSVTVGSPITPSTITFHLADASNNRVALFNVLVGVSGTSVPAGGSTFGSSTTTDITGTVTLPLPTYRGAMGTLTLTALTITPGISTVLGSGILAYAGPPTEVGLVRPPQTDGADRVRLGIQPQMQLYDAGGNKSPRAGILVSATVISGGATVLGTPATTDSTGLATFVDLALTGPVGPQVLQFSSPGLTPVSFSSVALRAGAPASVSIAAGDGQSATVGTAVAVPPRVLVRDASNNPVSAIAVAFATTGGLVTPTTAFTDVTGNAVVTSWSLGSTAGTNTLTATVAGVAPVTFTATGTAGAAASMTKNAGDAQTATVSSTVSVAPSVVVKDAAGNPLAGRSVTFAVASGGGTGTTPTSTTNASGIATAGSWTLGSVAGANTLTATSGTFTATFTATGTAGAAASMTKNAGDAQTATVNSTLPVAPRVVVKDAAGNPVAGASVTFAVASGRGSVTGPATTTNASGIATVGSWTLGSTAGANSLTATSGAFTATFTATGTAGTAAKLVAASSPPVSVTVGAPITPSTMLVQVADAAGNAVSTILPITVTGTVAPSGTMFTITVSSNASGLATFTLPPYVGPIGTLTLTATSGSLTALTSGSIPVLTGAAASLAIATQPPATAISGVNFSVAPKVQVLDAGANPVSQGALTVTATFAGGSGTLAGATTTTNSAGLATFSAMSITGTVGPRTLGFASGSLVSALSSTIAVTAGAAASMIKSAGDAQTATAGSVVAIAPQVRVLDASSNPVAGVSVTFGVATGGGSLTGTNPATTDAAGFASIGSWKLGTTAGPNTMTATAGALNAVFSATGTAGSVARLRLASGIPASITVGAAFASPVTVQLIDALGNPVSGAGRSVGLNLTVTPSGTSVDLTATTDASGLATFTLSPYAGLIGNATFTATSTGLTTATSGSIPVVAGSLSSLVTATQPSATAVNGVAFAVQPAVQLADVGGNPVSGSVNIIALKGVAGSYTLGGTTIAATDASGLATFSTLRFDGSAGIYSLRFNFPGGPTSPLTNNITLTAGTGTKLSITTQPSATATNGTVLATQPVIQLTDVSGNPVTTAGVVVTASIATGSGSLANATATTVAGGTATFSGLAITGTAGSFTLNFDGPSYSTATSGTITVGAGVAAKLLATTGFSDGQSGVPFGTQPAVRVLDSGDNPVLQAGIPISVSIATGGGTLGGTTPVNTNASGVATFTDLVVTGAAGPRTFAFSGPSLATIGFGPINVTAGAGSKLVFSPAPGSSATNAQPLPVQPALQLKDASDNPVALAGVVVNATFASEYPGSLTGTSATTDAAGIATFSGLTITGSVGSYSISFGSASLTAAVSGAITLAPGTPTQIAFTVQPSDALAGLSIAPPVQVTIKDISGNTVPLNGSALTLSLTPGTGNEGGILGGTNPKGSVNGVATFSDLTVSVSASGYSLTATSGIAGVPSKISLPFNVASPGPSAIETVAGAQTAVLPRTTIPAGTIQFRVRDLANNPVPNVDVTLSGNRADCNFVTGAKSNALGIVSVAVTTDSMTKGCTMIARASGVELSAAAQIATVPYAATHAWFGGTPGGPTEFELAGNWVNIATKANEIPGTGSTPFVPFWPTLNFPVASKNKSVAGIYSDTLAYLDLAGNTLTTSASVNATVLGGMTTATGSGVTLRGQFDSLTAGVAGLCGSRIPEFVVADSLFVPGKINVVCGLVAKALFTDGLVTSVPGAFVKIPAGGLFAADRVSFLGDSIVVDSSGTAALGDATIGGLLRISKGTLYVSRTSMFGGAGTVDTATVNLLGDATFTGASRIGYRFSSGQMYLQGNFTQTATFGAAFVADASHIAYFIGGAPQSINFAAPGLNRFGSVVTNNAKGVNLLSSVNLASAPAAGNWWAYTGPVTVPTGVTLAVPSFVDFVTGGTMQVDGALTLTTCFKDALTNPFSGTGSVNGIRPPIEYSCTYTGSGGGSIKSASGAELGQQTLVSPPMNRVKAPVIRKPVKVVRLRPRAR